MNHGEALAREPRAPSKKDAAPALSSFVTEASMPAESSASEPSKHVLWEFPEESKKAFRNSGKSPAIRRPAVAMYFAFAAAVIVAVLAGVWWRGSLPVTEPASVTAAVPPAVVTPPVDMSQERRLDTISSVELGPFIGPPLARVVANAPRMAASLPQPVPDDRQPTGRQASLPRGTSGGAAAAATPTLVPRPRTETAPSALAAPIAPATPAASLGSLTTTNPGVTARPVDSPPALETSVAPSSPPPRTAAPVVRPEPQALPSVVARSEQTEIQRTLGQYRSAYQQLDAEAARAVWPTVDVRALARAFDTLTSQELAFETCLFDIAAEKATAQCRGSATYTPKVGGRGPKLEPRQWTFHLRKMDEGWKIESAQAKR